MSVRSACNGKVLADDVNIPEVRSWTFTESQESKEFSSSSTACTKKRLPSVSDSSGSFELYIDPDIPFEDIIAVGDEPTLKLFEDLTDFWTIPVIIDEITVNTPIEDGDPVNATVTWSGNGAVVPPAR